MFLRRLWLVILLLPALAAAQEDDVSRHFLAARQAQASGNFDLAAREYKEVVRLAPTVAEAKVNLGLVYYIQGHYRESVDIFEKALAQRPDLRGPDLFLGIDYVKLGEPRRAIPRLKKAIVQEPANKEGHTWLSTALWDSGAEAEAISELRDAARTFPSDPDVLFLLGQAYRNSANEQMEHVLADTGTPLYHLALGDIYKDQRDWEKAERHYRRALEKDPHCPGAHQALGEIYREQGKGDRAQAEFDAERANSASPNSADYESYRQAKAQHALALSTLSDLLAAHPDSPRAHQLLAQTLAEQAKDSDALAEYRKAEAGSPGLAGLHFAIGQLLWKAKKTEDAVLEFQKELYLNPGHAESSAAIGAIFVSEHQPDRAIPYLTTALQLKPPLLVAHRELGKAYLQRQDFAKAEIEFRKAATYDPEGNVHYLLGTAYKNLGKTFEANAAFAESRRIKLERLESVDLHDDDSQLSIAQEFDRAVQFNSRGLYSEAVASLRRIVALDPTHWSNRYNLAIALLEARQNDEAAQLLQSLSAEVPNNGAVLDLLGIAYESLKQPDNALNAYRKAVAADPASRDYYLDYTRLLIDLDRYDESEQFLETGLSRLSGDYALTVRLGSLQMLEGKFDLARQTFQKAIEENPGIALAYVALGQTYLHEHREDDALKVLNDAAAKLPPDAMLEHYRGLALVRLSRYQDALEPLETAIRIDPNSAETHYLLGKADLALNRDPAARSEFETAIRLDSSNAGAYYQLSRIYEKSGDSVKAREMAEKTTRLNRERRETELKQRLAALNAPAESPANLAR